MTSRQQPTRIALVTGASRGLGAAVAEALAVSGAHVVLAARSGERLEEVHSRITSAGGQATVHAVDLTKAPAVEALAATLSRAWGRLDVLIANAAVLGPMSELSQVTDAAWLETIDTNLTANWRLLRAFDRLLRRSEAGRVVVLTSSAASRLKPRRGPYAVSKAALEVLAKTYALETEDTPIRVNLVDPGAVDTTMRAAAVPNEDRSILPQPEDVAPLIVELTSTACMASGQSVRFADWRSSREPANRRSNPLSSARAGP